MEALVSEISRLLNDTLSPEENRISSATDGLVRLSEMPDFAHALITISTGGETIGQRLAAATYLKNYTKRFSGSGNSAPDAHSKFRNQLVQALLQSEPAVLKILVEAFHFVVIKDFVERNSWPELVPELKVVIQKSLSIGGCSSEWKAINTLAILKSIVKPFQYFLNPKLPKEPVPPQLELITKEILIPLQPSFCLIIDKALSFHGNIGQEVDRIILVTCKCLYFTVRSHMPLALIPVLPSFCRDLFRILDSVDLGDANISRLKIGKRILIILSTLVTRHRKHSDKLMSSIINSAFKIARHSGNVSRMDSLSERVISLAFDVISNVLETGPGWRLVSPHFSSLLESAIFPALVLNEKDISEWEEDHDEYMRKNHPSDLEVSAWADDLFTARKSAVNLLGVIALSKGPPVVSTAATKRKKGEKSKRKDKSSSVGELLILPFLSKFPLPSNTLNVQSSYDYYGVLMAYGGLQDFLKERNSAYTTSLIQRRILPIYTLNVCFPYLIAAVSWVIGELASCLPQEIHANIYSSLAKALAMPDQEPNSFYPARVSSASAIAQLLENDYLPLDWLPLLEVIIERMNESDEREVSMLFQLLSTVVEVGQQNVSTHIPVIVSKIVGILLKHLGPTLEPWPQVVERGFASLAGISEIWEDYKVNEGSQEKLKEVQLGCSTIVASFSSLLQNSWLVPLQSGDPSGDGNSPPPSCIDDASVLLGFILRSVQATKNILELRVSDLLVIWTVLIADYDAWEEMEDLKIFNAIKESILLHTKYNNDNFFMRPTPPYTSSIIERIGIFITNSFSAHSYASKRACLCAHLLLHAPNFSSGSETIKRALSVSFTQAAFSLFIRVHGKPTSLWKPLLLVVSSCYLCYPDKVEETLKDIEENGYMSWACALAQMSNSSFELGLASESEMKLAVMALKIVVERLLYYGMDMGSDILHDCFISLMDVSVRLKEVQEAEGDDDDVDDDQDEDDDDDDDDDVDDDDDEDSEDDEREETEEEFLDRYAMAAAAAVENDILEEDDVDDESEELELGVMSEVDVHKEVFSLIQRCHQVLVQGPRLLTPQLITGVLNMFPEYGLYFQSFAL